MNCFAENAESNDSQSTYQLGLVFAIAWASTDVGLLPVLPEAIGIWLKADRVHLTVTQWDGTVVHDHAFGSIAASEQASSCDTPTLRFERKLGSFLTLSITIHGNVTSQEIVPNVPSVECVFDLLHTALESLLVTQNDRNALGTPFNNLADREWQVCQALEGSETEKLMASQLGWSSHTLHSYVKGIYRKVGVQSRLEVVRKLKEVRLQTRRETFNNLTRYQEPDAA